MLEDDVSDCMFNLGDEVLEAKGRADAWSAKDHASSSEPYHAGEKEEERLCNTRLSAEARAQAGTRAMRKFWEAKVAARRVSGKKK
jgi:hypothetical protein